MEHPHETTWVRLGYKIPCEPSGDQAMEATTGAWPGQVDPWRSFAGWEEARLLGCRGEYGDIRAKRREQWSSFIDLLQRNILQLLRTYPPCGCKVAILTLSLVG